MLFVAKLTKTNAYIEMFLFEDVIHKYIAIFKQINETFIIQYQKI